MVKLSEAQKSILIHEVTKIIEMYNELPPNPNPNDIMYHGLLNSASMDYTLDDLGHFIYDQVSHFKF